MAAGDPGFRDFYLRGIEETRKYGKRPDLLIFPSSSGNLDDVAGLPFETLDPVVKDALAALEVRSSKFEAIKYIAVREEEKRAGKKAARAAPSFTVKVEDLIIVYRWIERYRKPQAYLQVFFDSVFGLNILNVFQIVGSSEGFTIETPAKSQEKATIMIPITSGRQVGTFESLPRFDVGERVTRLGRHDAFVVPVGGVLRIDRKRLSRLLGL